MTLVLTPASIAESGGTSAVTATLDHPSSEATEVMVSAAPVSPAVEGDYTLSASLDLTIPAGETDSTGEVTITAVDNDAHAPDKTVTVSATATNTQGVKVPQDATLTITDDDDSPATGTVTVTTATTFTEGETLTADTSGIDDEDGLDNAAWTYQWVRAPAGGGDGDISGATSQTYTPVFADAGAALKVRVEVTDDEGHQATFTSASTSAVAALPRPSVTVVSDGDVTEGGPALFTLTRTGDAAETLDVAYEVTATGDFGVTTGAGTATFPANNATVQVSLATTGDDTHEAHGSVTLTLPADTAADPAWLPGDPAAATAAVEDDDDSPATGAVTITGTPTEGETLTADTSEVTDADGLDNAGYAYQWVRTPVGGSAEDISGATSETYTPVFADAGAMLKVRVTVTDDEGHEAEFTSAPTSAVEAGPRPSVTVASDGDVTEGNPAVFTLTRERNTAGTLDVAYDVTATGNFGVATGAGTATFPANESTVQVSVDTTDDEVHEAHGSVTVTLTADAGANPVYLPGNTTTATAAVRDDDDSPATGAVAVVGTAAEGKTLTAEATDIADADGLDNADYAWQWVRTPSGGSAEDISGATSETYVPVFADAGATLKARLTVTDDEGHEATFESAPTSAVAALPRPSVTVVSDGDVTEGDTVTFTLSRTGDTAGTLDVDYEVTVTGDFGAAAGAGTATFLADSPTVQVSVATTGDGAHEAHGSVTLTLTADTSADPAWLLGAPSTAAAAVEDDDDSPATGAVTVTTATAFTEGATLTADTSGLADADGLDSAAYTYQWVRTPAGGSDADISGATSQTYVPVFADAGATLKAKVTVTDDEGHEASFTSAPTSAVAAAPRPSVTVVPDGDVTEGSDAVFILTRTMDPSDELVVTFAVTGGNAVLSDEPPTEVTFKADADTARVTLETVDDNTHEADANLTLTLMPAAGADPAWVLGDPATATITVQDDDAPTVTLILTPDTIAENGGSRGASTVTARLDRSSSADVWVDITFTPVGTPPPRPYRPSSNLRLLIPKFATASTRHVSLQSRDDDVYQGDRQVLVSGEATHPLGVKGPEAVLLTVTEDDDPPSGLSISDAGVLEGDSGSAAMEFTVTLDPPATGEVTVDWATADGTATAGEDYTAGNGSLTFGAGEDSKTVSVPVTGDDVDEPNETFTVTLSNPSGASLGRAEGTGDDHGQRRCADGDAGPDAGLNYGGGRAEHGDGDPGPSVERGDGGDGVGGAGVAGGGGRLHAEHGPGADDCGGRDGEHGRGDDHRHGQRCGRAQQDGDGVGHGDERPGNHGPAGRDADDQGRRERGADGRAGDRRHDAGGGRDADGGCVGHRRFGRAYGRGVHLAVASGGVGRRRDGGRDRGDICGGRR